MYRAFFLVTSEPVSAMTSGACCRQRLCWAQIPLLLLRLPHETYIWHWPQLCSGFPLATSISLVFPFLLSHVLNQNLIDLILLEEISWDLVCIYYFTRLIPDCGIAVSWDFSHGSFQPYCIFFWVFSIWQHTAPSQKRCQGLDLLRTKEGKKIPSPLEPELLKMFQVPVSCHLLLPASLSVYLWHPRGGSGVYTGQHISTFLELLVDSMVSLLAQHTLWGIRVSSRREGQVEKSCSVCWVGLSQVSAAISAVEQKKGHW